MRKVYVEWPQIWAAVMDIVDQVNDSGVEIYQVIGVSRGGIIPAAMVARKLDVGVRIVHPTNTVPAFVYNSATLIVDDIFDSGETINRFFERASWEPDGPRALVAVLHDKIVDRRGDLPVPRADFYHSNYQADEWVVYPWEIGEDD